MPEIEEIRRSNVLDLIARKGGQRHLADAVGISPAQISQWVNRSPDAKTGKPRVMNSKSARRMEVTLGLPTGWMDTPHGGDELATQAPAVAIRASETRPGYARFQRMDAIGGAGPGMINPDYPEVIEEVEIAEWQLREELGRVPSPSRVKLLTVRGDSMSPRIRNGDVVFVDTEDKQYQDGALFVVVLHGHALVKRLEIRTDGLHIVSLAAPDRPDVVAPDNMDGVHIAGRVLGAIQLRRSEDL